MYQEKYWKEIYQLKTHLNYVDLYLIQSERYNNIVNCFLAIASSSSIAGWAIWQKYAFVWGIIIASSQVITVINSFLPYKNRLKSLPGLRNALNDLMIFAEKNWYPVSEGELTDKEIHELQFKLRTKKNNLLETHVGESTLPEKKKLFLKAQASAEIYFNNFYPIEGEKNG